MSLRIIRAGLLDTIQDSGRYGQQHLGINPGGAMDRFSAQLANALVGKELNEPVIEFHFPAAQIMFEKDAVICITGANFNPTINNKAIPLHHPVAVSENSLLKFEKFTSGARCYLSVWKHVVADQWLGSYSTNLKAGAGGFGGKALTRYDLLPVEGPASLKSVLKEQDFVLLPWTAHEIVDARNEIEFLIGSEWHCLNRELQQTFQEHWFQITNDADRMGYRLAGPKLEVEMKEELVSSAVSFGTVQLLPNGQLIILMADHQTTGGYPRIAHVISAHLPILAQKKPNDVMRFKMTDLDTAETKMGKQQKYLHEIQIACKFKMEKSLYASL